MSVYFVDLVSVGGAYCVGAEYFVCGGVAGWWLQAHRLVHNLGLQQAFPDIGASPSLSVGFLWTFLSCRLYALTRMWVSALRHDVQSRRPHEAD